MQEGPVRAVASPSPPTAAALARLRALAFTPTPLALPRPFASAWLRLRTGRSRGAARRVARPPPPRRVHRILARRVAPPLPQGCRVPARHVASLLSRIFAHPARSPPTRRTPTPLHVRALAVSGHGFAASARRASPSPCPRARDFWPAIRVLARIGPDPTAHRLCRNRRPGLSPGRSALFGRRGAFGVPELGLVARKRMFPRTEGGCGRFSGRPRRPAPAASCGRLSYRTPCALPRRTPSASPPGTSGSTRRARRRTARRRPRASPSRGRTRP